MENLKQLKSPRKLERGQKFLVTEKMGAYVGGFKILPKDYIPVYVEPGKTGYINSVFQDEVQFQFGNNWYRVGINEFREKARPWDWTPSRRRRKYFKFEEMTIFPWL